jgi:hypothetical protein
MAEKNSKILRKVLHSGFVHGCVTDEYLGKHVREGLLKATQPMIGNVDTEEPAVLRIEGLILIL